MKLHGSSRDTATPGRVPTALLPALLIFATPAFACSCFSNASPCSEIKRSYPVFVALVLKDSGEGWGAGPTRLRIEERLANASGLSTEIDIDTAAGTSCYRRLRTGERYVIFASPKAAKDTDWTVGGCNPTFALRGNEHWLDALRNAATQGPSRLVGTVRRLEVNGLDDHTVAGAVVTAVSPDGEQSVVSDSEGAFVFPGILPGRYRLDVAKPGFLPASEYNRRWSGRFVPDKATGRMGRDPMDASGPVLVTERSCTEWSVALWPDHRITGRIVDQQGGPFSDVTVEAFPINARGDQDSFPLRTAKTNATGQYTLRPLPDGEYDIGVNASRYRDSGPYPSTKFPHRVRIADGQPDPTINLTLPPQRTATTLRIRVIGPDGAPLHGTSIDLTDSAGRTHAVPREQNSPAGTLTLPVYLREQYTVKVRHSPSGRMEFNDLSGQAQIAITTPNPEAIIVLGPLRRP